MGIVRSVFFSAMALVLTACATEEGLFLDSHKMCVTEADKKQSPVSWKQAKVIKATIRDGDYDPAFIELKVGEPTILLLANTDDTPRFYIDGEFFDSVGLAEMSVGSAKYEWPCISGITIGAGKIAELRLVPLKAGIYYPLGNPLGFLGIPHGKLWFIYVNR